MQKSNFTLWFWLDVQNSFSQLHRKQDTFRKSYQWRRRACKKADRPSMINRIATVSTENKAQYKYLNLSQPLFWGWASALKDSPSKKKKNPKHYLWTCFLPLNNKATHGNRNQILTLLPPMVSKRGLTIAADSKCCSDYGMQSTMKQPGYNAVDKRNTDLPRMQTEQRRQPHQALPWMLEPSGAPWSIALLTALRHEQTNQINQLHTLAFDFLPKLWQRILINMPCQCHQR